MGLTHSASVIAAKQLLALVVPDGRLGPGVNSHQLNHYRRSGPIQLLLPTSPALPDGLQHIAAALNETPLSSQASVLVRDVLLHLKCC